MTYLLGLLIATSFAGVDAFQSSMNDLRFILDAGGDTIRTALGSVGAITRIEAIAGHARGYRLWVRDGRGDEHAINVYLQVVGGCATLLTGED